MDIKYVYEDDVTGLVYVKWDDYINYKEEFDTVGRDLLATWLTNGSIVAGIHDIGSKIAILTSWLEWVLDDYEGRPVILEDEIYHYYQVQDLIGELSLFYNDYKYHDSKTTILKFTVPFNIIWDHFSTVKIPIDDIFSHDWFRNTVGKVYERKVKDKLKTIENNIIKS
jgi:hypothetical protein